MAAGTTQEYEIKALHDLIADSEDWLIERILLYASRYRYTPYTSTLLEAWRASIVGISAPLIAALRNNAPVEPPFADSDFASDPVAGFGVEEAKRHRERGVTHTLFLGLMKHYRQAYVDLLLEAGYPDSVTADYRGFIDNFFDRMELGFSSEWLKLNQGDLVRELQHANLLITNEKNKFLTIFESLPNPVLFIDRSKQVVNLNRGAAALFYENGFPGRSYYSSDYLSVPPSLQKELEAFTSEESGGLRFEKQIELPHGTSAYIVIMQRMLDISGKFSGTIVILNDVTSLKRLEEEIEVLNTNLAERAYQLEQANQELETFNYSVSHDLRSPLTGIGGYCQLLLGTCANQLDEQCRDYISKILQTCNRMNQLITTMLEFARLAKCEVEREGVDLSQIAQGVAGGLRLEAPQRSVEFCIDDGVQAYGDPRLLRVVLENLLGNAWKFTARREEARIEFGSREMDQEAVYFVRDNGVGFDAARSARLFVPFQRLHSTEEYRGFGVGLATVQRIITRHGGRVWAEGEPDKGATIFFTLPVRHEINEVSA